VAPHADRAGADRPDARGSAGSRADIGALPTTPTDIQVAHVAQLAQRHGSDMFTVDEAAATWRTGVGTARSRVDRLIESGLLLRAGTLRPVEQPGKRPTRGRPPVLYRLTVTSSEAASAES
jgi:predicted ArsR family transcriptional regulator